MKPTYTLLPGFASADRPFFVRQIQLPTFATDFHFHSECQLAYIVSGSGTRIIGNSIEPYEEGDLTFIGSNVPHVWYSKNNEETTAENSVSIALYINPDNLVSNLSSLTDVQVITQFFKDSERGLKIIGAKKKQIIPILMEMLHQKDFDLFVSFMKICQHLVNDADTQWLNENVALKTFANTNNARVMKLMDFIQANFRSEISLEQVASIADMQLHSFCRYFKNLTHRTFSVYLSEIRVDFACKLLRQSDMPVSQIALEAGFSNMSYFNRCFKKQHGVTPRDFRNKLEMSSK
jgi:AraC-like DNA-binding protein